MFKFPFGNMQGLNLDWFLGKFNEYVEAWYAFKDEVEGSITDVFNARDTAVSAKDDAVSAKNDAVSAKVSAQTYSGYANIDALRSEGWAVGEQNNVPVASDSPYYHNSAKYYKQQADADAVATAADRVQTGLDRTATGNDATATAADALKAEGYASGTQNGTPVSSGSPYYQNNGAYFKQKSEDAADAADTFKDNANSAALRSEGYAVGKQNGTPVASGSPYYENNAEYYKDIAASVVLGADGAAAQAMIAGSENSMTVTQDYAAGRYVRVQGVLYKTTADVESGETLVVGTNCVVDVIGDDLSDVKNKVDYEFVRYRSENLLDKDSATQGYYFNQTNGTLVSSANQFAAYVEHDGAGHYSFYVDKNFFGSGALKVCLFNSSKSYIKTLTATEVSGSGANTLVDLELTSQDAESSKYFGYNYGISKLNTAMFVKGLIYPSTYIKFIDTMTIPHVKLINDNLGIAKIEENPLKGKKISLNGDSICAGAGYAGGYGGIIGSENNMIVQNIAQNGATIAADTYFVDTTPRPWVCRTISNMDADADYAIVEGGINDSVGTGGIGTISSGYDAVLDDTTFAGAFESMLKQLILRFKGKKIGYIAVHKATQYFSSNTTNPSIDYYNVAIACCKKWGVPVCDLNINCPPLGYIDDLKTAYTYNSDGWHPNENGYRKYYVPYITAWLKTL